MSPNPGNPTAVAAMAGGLALIELAWVTLVRVWAAVVTVAAMAHFFFTARKAKQAYAVLESSPVTLNRFACAVADALYDAKLPLVGASGVAVEVGQDGVDRVSLTGVHGGPEGEAALALGRGQAPFPVVTALRVGWG